MHTTDKYDSIVSLPHHVSVTRPQMPMSDRAAQFAPFAALTGYDSAIKETGRLTGEKTEQDEDALAALDMRYRMLSESLDAKPEFTITFYQADDRKEGGRYLSITGRVRKIDEYERLIIMQDGAKIPMDDISAIDGNFKRSMDET